MHGIDKKKKRERNPHNIGELTFFRNDYNNNQIVERKKGILWI